MWLRSLWYILTLRCDEADRLRVVSRGRRLSRRERIAERIHRGLCAGCRRAARELETIDRGLGELAREVPSGHPEWDAARRARLEAAFSGATGGKVDGAEGARESGNASDNGAQRPARRDD